MMMIEHLGKKFYVDKRLYEDLEIYVSDVVESNLDLILNITGDEGNGKSVLARQISWIISYILKLKYDIDILPGIGDLHFNLDSYIKNSIRGERFQINILDESRSLLNRKSSMTKQSKKFTNYLSECRKFNQFHILCLPAIHDLDKYVFMWRCRYFVHVIRSRDDKYKIVRGTYIVYPKNISLIKCYEDGYYQYPKFNPKTGGFKGSFNNFEVFDDMNKYEAKQRDVMEEKYILPDDKKDVRKEVALRMNDQGKSYAEIGRCLGITRQTISKWINELGVNDNK